MGFWNCKRFVGAALAVLALSMIATAQVSGNRPDFAHDRVLVKLSANFLARSPAAAASEPDIGVSISSLRLLNPSRETSNVTALARASANGRHNNIYVLTLKETGEEAVKNALERLNANPAVEIAEPVFYRRLLRTPNDPMFDLQYALDRLNAQQAWEITTGSRDIIVGIIDTGIDGAHPDLVDNLWINPNPNQNGYVNDIHGYNFADRMGGIPTDNMSSHGTHVAGIIGARGDNGVGITGINWTVSLAWLGVTEKDSPNSEMSTDRVIEAINYATIHGMHVLNNSYGGAGSSQLELETIRNFPGVFVAAAGNESSNNDFTLSYPANYDSPNVISVASTDARDMLSNFSNYGVSVHIAAPGGRILSTVRDGEYHEFSGTSMATPYVAGVAALVMAARPNYTPAQVREILLASMSRVPALDGFGFGIVDAHAAVTGSLDNLYSITYNFGYDGRGPVVRQTISGMEPVASMPPIREGYAFAGCHTSRTGG
ncbi:MAG: S8 family serine peptidase, partial [Chitinispirillales bacterium]|nr:S8 family serine peptidase [Chitinispirillales bacterium]